MTKGLKDLIKINPVEFEYNSTPGEPETGDLITYGIVAQDVMNTFPEIITTFEKKAHPDDSGPQKYYWLNPDKLQWVTINAFKELYARVLQLETQVKDLQSKIN